MKDAVTNKIRLLKDVEPNPDWLKSQRNSLLLEISESGKQAKRAWNLPGFLFTQPAYRPVLAFCLLLCLVFGGGFFVVQAAKDSLPGDLLYSVKITLENAQMKVSSQTTKPKLEAGFVGNRVEELAQIIEEVDDPIKKKEKVVKAVNKLQAQVASTKVYLDKIKVDNPEKAVEVVDAVNEKIAEAKKALEDGKITAEEGFDLLKQLAGLLGVPLILDVPPKVEEVVETASLALESAAGISDIKTPDFKEPDKPGPAVKIF